MSKIFIIEDDKKIRDELSIFLKNNGYEVVTEEKFENVVEEIEKSGADLVLLDLNLPGNDGYYICKSLRKVSNIPIIIVTSKNTEIDELMSMNFGADDFVTKPYNTQILLARIESILKRVNRISKISNIIEYGKVTLDISRGMIKVNDKIVELTKNELKILSFLLERRGTIVSRDELMRYLWDSEMFVDDNTLTVNINRLRKKLEELGVSNYIETRRGQGYIIN